MDALAGFVGQRFPVVEPKYLAMAMINLLARAIINSTANAADATLTASNYAEGLTDLVAALIRAGQ